MRQGVRRAAVVSTVAALAVTTGCSSDGAPADTTAASTSGGSAEATPSSSPSSSSSRWSTSSGPNDEGMTQAPPVEASPTWDKASREAATRAAEDVMTAFARPSLPQGRWWRDLAPMLSATAREVYKYVAVENVPVRQVKGRGEIVEDSSPYLATVEVKTDAGVYTILLSRSGAGAPWLAERIEPKGEAT